MATIGKRFSGLAAAALLCAGCDNGPPGAGMTNGSPPMVGGAEKAAERSDMPTPGLTGGSDTVAESAASSPATAGNNAGTGGRNGGQGGSTTAPDIKAAPTDSTKATPSTPPKIESPAGSNAQGETKPPGHIQTGTPRSPQ